MGMAILAVGVFVMVCVFLGGVMALLWPGEM